MRQYKLNLIKGIVFLLALAFSFSFVFGAVTYSDGDGTVFYTHGAAVCEVHNGNPYWNEFGDGTTLTNASSSCYRADGVSGTGNPQTTCCLEGYVCNGASASSVCVKEEPLNINSCSNFLTKATCESYGGSAQIPEGIKNYIEQRANIRDEDGDLAQFCHARYVDEDACVYYGNCGCKWNATSSGGGNCVETFVKGNPCNDDLSDRILTCDVITRPLQNTCSDGGTLVLSWTANLKDVNGRIVSDSTQTWCKSGERQFPCPTQTSLPFFSFFNVIVSLLMISAVYFLMRKRR